MNRILSVKKLAIVFVLLQLVPTVYYLFQKNRYRIDVEAYFVSSDGGISGLMSMVNRMGFSAGSGADNKGKALSTFISSRQNASNALKMNDFELLLNLNTELDYRTLETIKAPEIIDSIVIDTYNNFIKNKITSHYNSENNSMEFFMTGGSEYFVNSFTDNLIVGAEKFSRAWDDRVDSLNLCRLDLELERQTRRIDSLIHQYALKNDVSQFTVLNKNKVKLTILEMSLRLESEKLIEYVKMREMAYTKKISAAPLWVITRRTDRIFTGIFLVFFVFNTFLVSVFIVVFYFGGVKK